MGLLGYLRRTRQMQTQFRQTGTFTPPDATTNGTDESGTGNPSSAHHWGPILDESSVAASIPESDAVAATGQVVRVVRSVGVIDLDPVLDVQLLILAPRQLPRALATNLRVPLGQVPRIHPGAGIPLTVSLSDRALATIDWQRYDEHGSSAPSDG